MFNIVIFGAPGSGKGTQSEYLINHYGLFHISTGDVLRDHIKRGTELGKIASGYINDGKLRIEYSVDLHDPRTYSCGFIIEPGMSVWFLGNRITFKWKRTRPGEARHLYQTFQIANPKQIAAMCDGGI